MCNIMSTQVVPMEDETYTTTNQFLNEQIP